MAEGNRQEPSLVVSEIDRSAAKCESISIHIILVTVVFMTSTDSVRVMYQY